MAQQDLQGRTIEESDEAVNRCLKYRERKASLKTIYPGTFFNITISSKEADGLDETDTPQKQRAFIVKKMKLREKVLTMNEEGKNIQADIDLFQKILFVTGTEHMSPETYSALMAERKPEGEPQQRLDKPAPKKSKTSVVDGLKEKFGAENIHIEGETHGYDGTTS